MICYLILLYNDWLSRLKMTEVYVMVQSDITNHVGRGLKAKRGYYIWDLLFDMENKGHLSSGLVK